MKETEKFHTESIDRILKETSEELDKINKEINQSRFDAFRKVKAAQIGGPDIDLEPVVDRYGNVRYLEPRRRR